MKKLNGASNEAKNSSKKSKRKKILIVALIVLVLLPLLALAASIGLYAVWASGQHIDENLLPTASALPTVYDADGNVISEKTDAYVYANELSDNLKHAFIAVEDKRFYSHKGYDIVRMGGALVKNIQAGGIKEGASTITQQLVKNTHLTSERSIKRKLKEVALARDLERKYSKDDILSMYLSVIYFGKGAYGVKSAARTFFGKDISELTLGECATLAGIVKNPAGYSPVVHPEASKKRRDTVLSLMLEQGYISENECSNAKTETLDTVKVKNKEKSQCALYVELAKRQAADMLGITRYALDNSDVKIYTNLRADVQNALREEASNTSNFESDNISHCSVVIDSKSGAVLGLYGSQSYDVLRQTGSVLKPLAVYAPVLDMRAVTLATPIVDEKVDYAGFSPENFNGVYYGQTTVEEAIKKSMNSVSVKLLDYLGVDKSADYLGKFGFKVEDKDKNYSLALGSLSASPVDTAAAYGALARGGEAIPPCFVRYVVSDGRKYEYEPPSGRVISPAAATLVGRALFDTVKDGTARTLSTLPFDVAAKTGTAERSDLKNSDAWLASYNDNFTVAVWHGSDDGMTERGGGYPTMHAAGIWKKLYECADERFTLSLDADVVAIDIDEYSTSIQKKVVAASQNTPKKYRRTCYFDVNNLPSSEFGLFDSAPPCELSVKVREGHVEASFDTSSICDYRLYRTDILGRALIFASDGTGETVSVRDVPMGFGNSVEYELICTLKDNGEINSSNKKRVFFEQGTVDIGLKFAA